MNSFNADRISLLPSGEQLVIPVLVEHAQVEVLRELTGTVRVRKLVHEENTPLRSEGFRELFETTHNQYLQIVLMK